MDKSGLKVVLFDLDGTLLDTLDDLAAAVNHALLLYGLPERSRDEVRRFLGNGIRVLMERAVGKNTEPDCFEQVFAAFRAYYLAHSMCRTDLYEGIRPMLVNLRKRGLKIGIVSNKMQEAVTELHRRFFADDVDVAIGEGPMLRRKPCPDMVYEALRQLGAGPDEALYVGDSEVDIRTAADAGVRCLSVTWGFRDAAFLKENGAVNLIDTPAGIVAYVDGLNDSRTIRTEV